MVHVCVVEQCSSQICLHQARPFEVRPDKVCLLQVFSVFCGRWFFGGHTLPLVVFRHDCTQKKNPRQMNAVGGPASPDFFFVRLPGLYGSRWAVCCYSGEESPSPGVVFVRVSLFPHQSATIWVIGGRSMSLAKVHGSTHPWVIETIDGWSNYGCFLNHIGHLFEVNSSSPYPLRWMASLRGALLPFAHCSPSGNKGVRCTSSGATIDGFTSVFHSTSSCTIPFSRTGQEHILPGGHQCTHNGLCPIEQVAGVLFAPKGAIALLAAMRLKVFPPRPTLLISGPLRCES